MGRYTGKTAVITGGTTGIGFATARLLASEGARIVVTGSRPQSVDAAQKELGPSARAVVADSAKLGDLDRVVDAAREHLGHVDFLFVNAGIARFVPFDAVDERTWDEQHDVNAKGAFFAVQKLAPLFAKGAGVVLNTSVVAEKGLPSTTAYAASKAALRSLGRTLASELLPKGIRVNVVSPGPITTPILDKLGLPAEARAGFEDQLRELVPMKRFGVPDEVARAALFLAFDATFTTGAELAVDGGFGQV